MTRDEIIAFYESVTSFAVPTREETERVNALSPKDRRALLDYILERARASGIYEGTMEDIWLEAKQRHASKLAAE